MLISQVIKRLQELQTVESDIDVVLEDVNGNPVHEYFIDVHIQENGIRNVMVYSEVVEVMKLEAQPKTRSRSRR